MKTIQCNLPDSIYNALEGIARRDGSSIEHAILSILARNTGTEFHTLFQVSTSSALVEGLYQGAVRVGHFLERGDFGLGTFVDLDGEMVILDGVCYQVKENGSVASVENDRLVPYAVVAKFTSDFSRPIAAHSGLHSLLEACDSLRQSNNVFYAFRVEGRFSSMKTRVMRPVMSGANLRAAASVQAEFSQADTEGTLVGFWSPGFAGAFSVPGYHFHFLSKDRKAGGHVLECGVTDAMISGCALNEMHVALPETKEFLEGDLSRDPSEDIRAAEQDHAK